MLNDQQCNCGLGWQYSRQAKGSWLSARGYWVFPAFRLFLLDSSCLLYLFLAPCILVPGVILWSARCCTEIHAEHRRSITLCEGVATGQTIPRGNTICCAMASGGYLPWWARPRRAVRGEAGAENQGSGRAPLGEANPDFQSRFFVTCRCCCCVLLIACPYYGERGVVIVIIWHGKAGVLYS